MLVVVRCGQLGHYSSKNSSGRSAVVVGSVDSSIQLEHLVVVCESSFSLVRSLLVISPGSFTVSLLLGHTLVLHLDLLHVSLLSLSVLILEHATHSEDSFFLSSECLFLFSISFGGSHVLSFLLISPISLILSVKAHSVVVHYEIQYRRL